MRTSEQGIRLIKQFEGLALEAYRDIAGVWTIGYGHTGPGVKPGMRLSEREAETLLREDLKKRESAVLRHTQTALNQNEFDALVSFVYNIGAGAFRRSTALKRLNSNNRIGAAEALTWFNKATINGMLREVLGLTRRRAAERALFLTPTSPFTARQAQNPEQSARATPIETPPRRKSVAESRTVQGATVAGGAGAASTTLNGDTATEAPTLDEATTAQPPSTTVSEPQAELKATKHTESIEVDAAPTTTPSKDNMEADVQLALLGLIVVAVLFVVFARYDDWRNYRR